MILPKLDNNHFRLAFHSCLMLNAIFFGKAERNACILCFGTSENVLTLKNIQSIFMQRFFPVRFGVFEHKNKEFYEYSHV